MPAMHCLPTCTFLLYKEKKERTPWAVPASSFPVSVISECNSQQYAAYRKDQLSRGTKEIILLIMISFF